MTIEQIVKLVRAPNVNEDEYQAVCTFSTSLDAQNAYFTALKHGFDVVLLGPVLTIFRIED